jgi:hypothetical protein
MIRHKGLEWVNLQATTLMRKNLTRFEREPHWWHDKKKSGMLYVQ